MRRVWPTQLFELGLALAGLALVLLVCSRRRLAPGSLALLYAIWFSAARWAVLPLRELPYDPVVTEVVYPALYGFVILGCAGLLYRKNRRSDGLRENARGLVLPS